ncbi:hypothetical protein LINGRAHAP2_LOCUS19276 [Linum grandiflorum]
MCNKEGFHELSTFPPGEVRHWSVRDVAFPLVWCYLHVNDSIQGVFWGFLSRYRCDEHCDWRIRDYGLMMRGKQGEEQYIFLYTFGEFF